MSTQLDTPVSADQTTLNDQQRAAVSIIDGPALVVAGAGTGKTHVIVERIVRLIESGVPAQSILALTFTEKAAAEMLDRVTDRQRSLTLDATIATYNGFGNDLLQTYGREWGLGNVRLLGDTGQLVFLREHLDEFELDYFAPVSRPDGQLSMMAEYVSLLKQQLVRPEDYSAFAEDLPAGDDAERLERLKHRELARFYTTYLKLCRTNQVIDYDDQLFLSIELLRARPNILRQLQERYAYILVDEFQDTNPMQSALVDMLAGPRQNIMAVGDDDQSIYGWRGATLANILDFKQRYPAARDITLIENYRSTQAILDSAYRLIQANNPDRLEVLHKLDKRLHGQTNDGPAPRALHFASLDAELAWVAEDIASKLKKGQQPGTIAVLARRNAGVQKIHELLELHGIAHAVTGMSSDMYEQPAVRQLLEVLKVLSDPLDDMALFHTLSGPLFAVEPSELSMVASTARQEHTRLADAASQATEPTLPAAIALIDSWRAETRDLSVGDAAYKVITDSGWKQQLYERAEQDIEIATQVQALSKLFKTLKEFERIADVASVQNYVANLPALKAAGSGFEDPTLDIADDLVNVLSVHRSKGLEWDSVYVIDCTEGSFPMRNFGSKLELPTQLRANRSQADEHLAEERRLMYVAATRARRELILTYADQHGGGAPRKASRFIAELLGDHVASEQDASAQTSLELFAPRSAAASTASLPAGMLQDGEIVLSVSQIDCWLRCPQDFYYRYVLAMPTPSNPALQYGTAIHAAIEALHRGRISGTVPTLESLREQLIASLPTAGYLTARSRERAHAQALQTIELMYQRFSSEPLPIEIERSFGVTVPAAGLKIVGRMDAVYQQPSGIEIRDFKTGTSVNSADKAKRRATGSTQLTLYALAWQHMHDEMPALLTLDFVETGFLGSVRKQAKSLDTLTGKLVTMTEQLHRGEYPAGKDHEYCDHPVTS